MATTQTLRQPETGLYHTFRRLYDKPVDGTGLAVFRIVFSLVMMAEIGHLFYFRHLVFDPVPFITLAPLSFTTPLVLWLATLLLLLVLGWHTRAAAVVNYGFALVFFASLPSFSYMMTPVYTGMSLLFLFLPIGRRLSLDRLQLKLRYSTPQFRYQPPGSVSQLAYFVPVVVGISFVYLDSTLYKLTSPMWLTGLGMWHTLSLPYEVQLNGSFLLNQEVLVKFLGYLTLAFEFLFLFLLPFRRYRVGLLVVGVGLHLGILVLFTLPLFALGFGSIYLLMVPAGWWRRLLAPRAGPPALTFYYDAECPLCARTRVVLEHFDVRRAIRFGSVQLAAGQEPALQSIAQQALLADVHSVDARGRVFQGVDTYIRVFQAIAWLRPLSWLLRVPGIYHLARAAYGFVARNRSTNRCSADTCGYSVPAVPPADESGWLLHGVSWREVKRAGAACGIAGLLLLQAAVSYNTPLLQLLRRKSGLESTWLGRAATRASSAVAGPAITFFGITNHPIALDEHFAGYTRLVAVTYTGPDGVEQFLPITRPSGQPGAYLYGAVWLRWTYGLVSKQIEPQRLAEGIRSFTAFWAGKHHVDLQHCRFQVKVKKIAEPHGWEPNFLNRQLAAGWQPAGDVTWTNQQFEAHLVPNISSL
ncbi:hypothetical protein GCM10022409_31370 [Hymenobacter glaciei]|uniref:HTTM-like domain-containing protein n=1 Tax=Hymenobacter glaciei TaxID=877209 RepID=A0ABP7UGU7_9BACT